ncbi:acyltransferase family protein [Mucilaginibacter myungsuensis]|uniref:Acyltransferase n=1 Tax=Mucilaginibacter myungsuensis TaxID=649104 RepID=A0A929L197_9SPHI|nr:acyltransferase [Mucilaginibacter myungsuensis]MBE9662654.1 acyltransferase [Mucilaginibacter myungsuensis]MDN3598074.1 acyltransferase [Mucilaginibacter myungsuensis]
MTNTQLATKPHYPILDGLRGVAAIIVVTFHLAEPFSTGNLDKFVNHGYLAVDFFFLLSGFVMGYAYDDRWHKMTVGEFFKRRIIRLQPMVVLGMTLGAIGFYFTDSTLWPLIHTVPLWKMLLVLIVGYTILPVPLSLDIRGWEEMHPLNSVGWSLFFEYVANILYAIGIRKFSKSVLGVLVAISAIALAQLAISNGDVSGGWTLNQPQMRIGFTRVMYPFFAGLLLSRIAKPAQIKNSFLWCGLLVAVVFYMPRIGGADDMWLNGIYDSVCIIILFPLIVYLGASGVIQSQREQKVCKFLGDLSYPLYLVHYPIVYFYVAWISNNKGMTLAQAWPYALAILIGATVLAYAALKWYDEPVRKWLREKLG